MSTDLVPRPTATVPSSEWLLMQSQAVELAKSNIIPSAYQGRPANVIVAAITGRRYGWDVLTAMRNGHVIEGQWTMAPKAELGLVRLAGHSVKAKFLDDGAWVKGTRADNGDEMEVTFTYDDALTAGLIDKIEDGKPRAQSKYNKPLPWQQYPKIMCHWRAVGQLCSLLFSDITSGVYSSEEIGALITPEGEVIDADEVPAPEELPAGPHPLSDDILAKFRETCETEGLTPEDVIGEAFGPDMPEVLTEVDLPALRDAFRRLVERKAQPAPEVRPASKGKVGLIKAHYAKVGYDRDVQLANTGTIIGRPIKSHNDLTEDEADQVIEAEGIRHDEKLPGT